MHTFSVVTANFNSGDKLAETLESVLCQDASLEHILVDGGSTDSSIVTAREYSDRYRDRVRLISERDAGIYDAMNKGIRHAKGRYIFFLGAGDRLFPGVLPKIGQLLPPHEKAFIYGDVVWSGKPYDGPFTWRKLCEKNICHQSIFYGRDVFMLCGDFSLRYRSWADWEMNIRAFGCPAVKKQYVPVEVADFEAGGISLRGDPEFDQDKLRLIRRYMGLRRYGQIRLTMLKNDLRCRAGRLKRQLGLARAGQ